MSDKTFIAIDLKSFYASVECVMRGLDPLTTNLVVADASRTEKTICLAVSPSLKVHGIPGRPRLFEVVSKVKEINKLRSAAIHGKRFVRSSWNAEELKKHPEYELEYITATPRMAYYMEYSTQIYNIYLKYVAPEDIHVYSVDEVFIDATGYLSLYKKTPREFAQMLILDVLHFSGITATAGIGTNLYLCKIAMDIVAKHIAPDENGVRIAELDEFSYREQLWEHKPLTDFWRIGHGISKKLEANGMYTMGDVARCSIGGSSDFHNENLLFRLFGVNAELLIDHAWGWESCTMADIKSYTPSSTSLSSGQVLSEPYTYEKTKVVIREMAEGVSFDLVKKKLKTDQVVLSVGYDAQSLSDKNISSKYNGIIKTDRYGKQIPKEAHGSYRFPIHTSSAQKIIDASMKLFEKYVDQNLLTRRITIAVCNLQRDLDPAQKEEPVQANFLSLMENDTPIDEEKEKRLQETVLSLKGKYGKNIILRGTNFREGATAKDRNKQIGGHKA